MPFRGCSCGHSGGFRIEGRKEKRGRNRTRKEKVNDAAEWGNPNQRRKKILETSTFPESAHTCMPCQQPMHAPRLCICRHIYPISRIMLFSYTIPLKTVRFLYKTPKIQIKTTVLKINHNAFSSFFPIALFINANACTMSFWSIFVADSKAASTVLNSPKFFRYFNG